jgi:hypothetical protein
MAEQRGFHPIALLRGWARSSPWVMIAIALHLIVIAGAAVLYTARHEAPKPDDITQVVTSQREADEEPLLPPEVPIDRRSIPKNEDTELAPLTENVYVVDRDVPESLKEEVGDPDGSLDPGATGGTAIGVGRVGHAGAHPSVFPGRDRVGNGRPKGDPRRPPEPTEEAVLWGLRWLARHQNDDGSWSPATLRDHCDCDLPAYNPKRPPTHSFDTGLTGMALLCFLGRGLGHDSRLDLVDPVAGRRYKVGQIVKKGLQWLVKSQNPDGSFTPDRPFLYNEALAAMAVSEAYGLTGSRVWREPAQRAVNFLQEAQRPSPLGAGLWGWRYASRQEIERFRRGAGSEDPELQKELYDADTSVTGWCVMALKSGQLSGLDVKPESLAGGAAFARYVTQLGADGRPTGLVGYLDAKGAGAKVTGPNDEFTYHPGAMSALGMCVRIFAEHDAEDPFLKAAAERIVQDLPEASKDRLSIDYYYWYYASLALNQVDGPDAPKRTGRWWGPWNKAMAATLVPLQDRSAGRCTAGGWMDLDRWAIDHGGPLYTTALNVLTLEVYYRYENAFGGWKRH